MTSKSALELILKALNARIQGGGFDKNLSKLQLLSGGDGRCKAKLKVDSEHKNIGGVLHGGLTATLVDSVSTFALMTTGKGVPGTSVDLQVSFMKPAKVGEEILIEAETLKIGKNLAFLQVFIRNEVTGKVLATGQHTKFIG